MRIGIDASFLRKPTTGIGQVTEHFLRTLIENRDAGIYGTQDQEYILYTQEPVDLNLPKNFTVKTFLPTYWKRDDVPRQWLWERQVAREAIADGCDTFLSLYQSATIFDTSDTLKHVMLVHDIIPKFFPEYVAKWSVRWHYRAIERGICSADKIIAISQSTKNDIVSQFGLVADTIVVAYPGISPIFGQKITAEYERSVLAEYRIEPGYIYHGGGLEIRKNAERILRAYAYLVQSREKVPQLIISGHIYDRKNTLATDVVGLITDLGLTENVKLLGRVPEGDLPVLYRGALFFVFPSLYEGFGLPVVEAMAMGCPVITSTISSLPEVGGDAVLFVNPSDIQSIRVMMEQLLDDGGLRENLGYKGRKRAKQFSYTAFAQAVLDQCI